MSKPTFLRKTTSSSTPIFLREKREPSADFVEHDTSTKFTSRLLFRRALTGKYRCQFDGDTASSHHKRGGRRNQKQEATLSPHRSLVYVKLSVSYCIPVDG